MWKKCIFKSLRVAIYTVLYQTWNKTMEHSREKCGEV